jgi:hypothetical protein
VEESDLFTGKLVIGKEAKKIAAVVLLEDIRRAKRGAIEPVSLRAVVAAAYNIGVTFCRRALRLRQQALIPRIIYSTFSFIFLSLLNSIILLIICLFGSSLIQVGSAKSRRAASR